MNFLFNDFVFLGLFIEVIVKTGIGFLEKVGIVLFLQR